MDSIKYYVVANSAKKACAEALDRYIHDQGGVETCIETMQELDYDLMYHPEFFSKIPESSDCLFVITVSGIPSDGTS